MVQPINGMTLKQGKKLTSISRKGYAPAPGYCGIFGTFSEVVVW
jgi:hypothetical protein